ncbi:MAG TPA: hypothetical protein VFU22_23560, partial [Roseiflexaceae bacterium]|nr:hypothetical protein [Roseiflexaceae bacterium]
GGYAYIGGTIDVGGATGRFFNAFLSILDLREPATPRPVGDYRGAELLFGGGVGTIAVNEVIVYLGITNGSALYTLDVHDPAHPALLGSLPISASDIRIEGQFAYLAGTPAGLMILDIRNPAALAARYVDDGSPTLRGVDVSGDLIYAASDVCLKAARFLPRTIALVPPGGATIETTVGRVTYTIPTGAFSDTVMLDHRLRPANDLPPAPGLARIGPAFEITASYTPTGEMMSPTLPITIMVGYTDVERGPAVANTLGLYYLDGGTWARASVSLLDPIARRVSVASKRQGVWAVMGEPRRAFIPTLRR